MLRSSVLVVAGFALGCMALGGLSAPAQAQSAFPPGTKPMPSRLPAPPGPNGHTHISRRVTAESGVQFGAPRSVKPSFRIFGMPVEVSSPVAAPYSNSAYRNYDGQPAMSRDSVLAKAAGENKPQP